MDISKNTFRKYDIRGIYPDELNEEIFWYLGKGLGTFLQNRDTNCSHIVVGRDNRKSSVSLFDPLIKGLLSTGLNVTGVGVVPFPAIHYFTSLSEYQAGVMITASHNPEKYNGLKVDYNNISPMHGEDLQKLRNLIKKEDFIDGEGVFEEKNLVSQYVKLVSSKFNIKRKLKVLVDCGNGATSDVVDKIFEGIGVELEEMFCELESKYSHKIPNPGDSVFMDELKKGVLESSADVGFGFDGDGDRLGVIDETGEIHAIDRVMAMISRSVLAQNPGGVVLYDVKSTQAMDLVVKKAGGVPKMVPTGRAEFLSRIVGGEALLGVEFSGHTFFKDKYLGFDDAIYAACRVLELMDVSGKKLSRLMQDVPKYFSTGEIQIGCDDDKKVDVVEKVCAHVKEIEQERSWNVSYIDGVRVSFSDSGWFLIRAKGTSPFISVRIEGSTEDELEKGRGFVLELLEVFDFLDFDGVRVSG